MGIYIEKQPRKPRLNGKSRTERAYSYELIVVNLRISVGVCHHLILKCELFIQEKKLISILKLEWKIIKHWIWLMVFVAHQSLLATDLIAYWHSNFLFILCIQSTWV